PIFWPQSGEYANTTCFLTDPHYETEMAFFFEDERVDQVALFTDGLQMLALNYAEKTGHSPFFLPLFQKLADAPSSEELVEPLNRFLDSPRVNERTDDDKTLVLAVRCPPH